MVAISTGQTVLGKTRKHLMSHSPLDPLDILDPLDASPKASPSQQGPSGAEDASASGRAEKVDGLSYVKFWWVRKGLRLDFCCWKIRDFGMLDQLVHDQDLVWEKLFEV